MTDVLINKRKYVLPGTWQELNKRQFLHIAPLLLGSNNTLSLREYAVMFYFIPGIKRFWIRPAWIDYMVKRLPSLAKRHPLFTEGQKWDLLQTIKFLFDEVNGRSILKSFEHKGIIYYMPGDNFTRESIIAFAFADEYFNRFTDTGDDKYIDLLIACIARQKGSKLYPALQYAEGDIREHFTTSRTAERAEAFKDLPARIRSAVMLYFLGSKKYIHKQYEILFRKKPDENEQQVEHTDIKERMKSFGKKKIPKPNFNWIGIIYELSEQGTFGSFDQVKNMFIHTCCYYLAKKRYEKEEQTI